MDTHSSPWVDSGEMYGDESPSPLLELAYEQAMMLGDDDVEKPRSLVRVALMFGSRYAESENEADLDQAILAWDHAVSLTPSDDPLRRGRLIYLGNSLLHRNELCSSTSDIDRAVLALELSVKLTPDCGEDKPGLLLNLGACLTHRFQMLGHLNDIDK
jgi:hypothetical protein